MCVVLTANLAVGVRSESGCKQAFMYSGWYATISVLMPRQNAFIRVISQVRLWRQLINYNKHPVISDNKQLLVKFNRHA